MSCVMARFWTGAHMSKADAVYEQQGFGAELEPVAPYGLLIIDLVNGFADPKVFGGGNIAQAIDNTENCCKRHANRVGPWRTHALCMRTMGLTIIFSVSRFPACWVYWKTNPIARLCRN